MMFLRECVEDGTINESLALFLIGDGEVSKTSLMRALMNKQGNTADRVGIDTRTVGMDMVDWHTTDLQGAELILKIKDVGGQQVYMKLHELLVLDIAMYLYLWRADSNVGTIIQSIIKWLNLLQSCVPGVAVVPLVTHIDCVGAADLETKRQAVQQALTQWQESQSSLPGSKDAQTVSVLEDGRSHGVNCLKGKGIAEFRTVLLQVAETTRGFHEPLPKTWKDLQKKIRGMGTTKKYIPWVEYKEVCKQCGIKDNMVLVVTSFLHETLELRFFGLAAMIMTQDTQAYEIDDILATTVYLDAEWMIDMIKGIVRHDHAALHQHFEEEKQLGLMHQARRLRVQGVISKDLLSGDYLWPGMDTLFWRKVAGRKGGEIAYEYERLLWDDGAKGLKKVVESERDREVAVDLLCAFKIIIGSNADYFCPDLVPSHKKDSTDGRSLDTVSSPYWHVRTFAQLRLAFGTCSLWRFAARQALAAPALFFILSFC
jgi:GTPase SAR1 family protein